MHKFLRLLALAAIIATPVAAQTVIFVQGPPFLPAKPPAPAYLAQIDPGLISHIGAVDMNALPGDIESQIGGVFHVAGPITLASGPVPFGSVVLSAPISYAEEMQADERIKVPGSRLEIGQRLYRADYVDMRGGTPKIVSA